MVKKPTPITISSKVFSSDSSVKLNRSHWLTQYREHRLALTHFLLLQLHVKPGHVMSSGLLNPPAFGRPTAHIDGFGIRGILLFYFSWNLHFCS